MSNVRPMTKSGEGALTSLGRFEILAPIGSGGMAAIYLARIAGPAGFEKPIALKVIHSHLSEDAEFVTMFLDEARIAAQLQHPNIVQIYELGESAGTYFMAMEYLRGETVGAIIQRLVARGKALMDPRMACHIAMEACEGLHHAHEMTDLEGRPVGLVHRDVSPQNLFVTYSGSVKLMDFGIARAAGLAHSTRPGSLKGKFSYMSPEQAQGLRIDRRADVFALGIVMWEMLTGRRLFKGTSDMDSLRRVREARIPLIRELRSGVPPDMDRVVARALARDVDERYQNSMELHADLSLVADQLGSPVTTHELGKRLSSWFPEEEQKKRALLSKTVPVMQMPPIMAGEPSPPAPGEETPSVSETSGVRLRDAEGDEGAEGTPSASVSWVPPQRAAEAPEAAPPDTVVQEVGTPARHPLAAATTEVDEISYAVAWATRPRRALLVAGIVFGLVAVGGLIGGAAFFLPRMLAREDSAPAASPVGSGGVAPPPAVAGPPSAGSPTPGAVPAPPGPGDVPATPDGPAVAPAAGPDAGQAETVTLRLLVDPPEARVTVGGVAQEDPESIVLPRSDEGVFVEVSAPGCHPASFIVRPDRDQDRRVELRRRRPSKRPTKRPSGGGDLVNNPYAPR